MSEPLADRVAALREDVDKIKERIAKGDERFSHLEKKIDANTDATKELVEAWRTAGGMVKFVKWVAAIITGSVALWIAVRDVLLR